MCRALLTWQCWMTEGPEPEGREKGSVLEVTLNSRTKWTVLLAGIRRDPESHCE